MTEQERALWIVEYVRHMSAYGRLGSTSELKVRRTLAAEGADEAVTLLRARTDLDHR